MLSKRNNLLLNNRFLVAVGKSVYSFSKISNIQDSFEVESIAQGGSNRHPDIIPKQSTRSESLILERGVLRNPLIGSIYALETGQYLEEVIIMVMNQHIISKIYQFDYGFVTKWEISPLDAMGKDVLLEKIEITHSGLSEVKIP